MMYVKLLQLLPLALDRAMAYLITLVLLCQMRSSRYLGRVQLVWYVLKCQPYHNSGDFWQCFGCCKTPRRDKHQETINMRQTSMDNLFTSSFIWNIKLQNSQKKKAIFRRIMAGNYNYQNSREWMYNRIDEQTINISGEFAMGMEEFMSLASNQPITQSNDGKFCCPCNNCKNDKFLTGVKFGTICIVDDLCQIIMFGICMENN